MYTCKRTLPSPFVTLSSTAKRCVHTRHTSKATTLTHVGCCAQLASVVVAGGGGGALVEYVADSAGSARLPGITGLGTLLHAHFF